MKEIRIWQGLVAVAAGGLVAGVLVADLFGNRAALAVGLVAVVGAVLVVL